MKDWGRWSAGTYCTRCGTKQFGVVLWSNSKRVGLQINFWCWEFQFMQERHW